MPRIGWHAVSITTGGRVAQVLGGLDVVARDAEPLSILLVVFVEVLATMGQGGDVVQLHCKPYAACLLTPHAERESAEPVRSYALQATAT
jgi:hypothetical protein